MVRAQIRDWGSDHGDLKIRALILRFLNESVLFCLNSRSFHDSANHFSVTLLFFFFKKYISFVCSQYKNKAHCTLLFHRKVFLSFFFFIFKWVLLLKQCSTVSCHSPWLSVGCGSLYGWEVISSRGFVGWLSGCTWLDKRLQLQFSGLLSRSLLTSVTECSVCAVSCKLLEQN